MTTMQVATMATGAATGPRRVATLVTRFQAGAGGVALRGALALDPERYRVTVVAGSGDALLDDARAAGLEVLLVPDLVPEISPGHDARAWQQLSALFRRRAFDVVHTHSAKAGTLGRLAALHTRTPLIAHTYHGFPFHEFQSRARRDSYVAIERWLGQRTDVLLAVGTQVATEAVRRGLAPPERLRTIGAAVDTVPPMTRSRRCRARQRLGVPPGVKVVGTVGRLDYQKAPEHFVDAIRRLDRDDVLAVWIGDGPLRDVVAGHVAAAGLSERFLLLGHCSDVPDLLPGLDVFAMSSRYEGLPCALIEAMSAGVPVVATAVNAVPDAVVPGETGLLVAPERPAQLAAAIRHLLDNPADARRMSAAASARLGGRFAADTLGSVLDEAYRVRSRRSRRAA